MKKKILPKSIVNTGVYKHDVGLVSKRRKARISPKVYGFGVLVLIVGTALLFLLPSKVSAPQPSVTQETVESEPKEVEPTPQAPDFNAQALKAAVNSWAKSQTGTYSVAINDAEGETLVAVNQNEVYFAASIYKLYVAYEGYRKIDDGTYKLSEPYLNGWTRGKCLDEMIRSSHSPCAEKMWQELGKTTINDQLKTYGFKNTSMTAITTSAGDAALILSRIEKGEGLSKASRSALLTSMKEQEYRQALPKGFSQHTVHNKVGFREKDEYHDVAIVGYSDGRRLVVSVLTKNVGSANIAGLAEAIQSATK